MWGAIVRRFLQGLGFRRWNYRYRSVAYKKEFNIFDEKLEYLVCDARVRAKTSLSRLKISFWSFGRRVLMYADAYGRSYPPYMRLRRKHLWNRAIAG